MREWLSLLTLTLGLVSLLALILAAPILYFLLRQSRRLWLRVEMLEQQASAPGRLPIWTQPPGRLHAGDPAPSFELPQVSGGLSSLRELLARQKPVVLIFTSPRCGPCEQLMPDVVRWQKQYSSHVTIAVIGEGSLPENTRTAAIHGLEDYLVQQEREVARAYQLFGTPAALMVLPDGTIGAPAVAGGAMVIDLVERVAGAKSSTGIIHDEKSGSGQPAGLPTQPARSNFKQQV